MASFARSVFFAALSLVALAAIGCHRDDKAATGPAPSASQRASAEPETVKLVARSVRVGDKTKSTRKSSLSLGVEFWQENQKIGGNDSVRSEEYAREVEVLAILGGAPGKVRVRYDAYHRVETHPGQPNVDSSSLAGHTYLLETTDSLQVKSESGKAVSPEEDETLKKLHGDLAEEDPIVGALGTSAIPVGKTVALRKVLFQALVSSSNGEFKSGSIVLSSVRKEGERDAAVFDWTADMKTEEDNGLEITWHLKGRAIVGLQPARTLHTTVEGTLDVGGGTRQNGALVELQGAGTFQDERVITPG